MTDLVVHVATPPHGRGALCGAATSHVQLLSLWRLLYPHLQCPDCRELVHA